MFHLERGPCVSVCCLLPPRSDAARSTCGAATGRPRCCTSSCATMRNWTRPHGTNMSQIITSLGASASASEQNTLTLRSRLILRSRAHRRSRDRPLTRSAAPSRLSATAQNASARGCPYGNLTLFSTILCESRACARIQLLCFFMTPGPTI